MRLSPALLLACAISPCVRAASSSQWLAYFGTYTGPQSKGIYVASYDTATGRLGEIQLAGEVARPSWVIADASGAHLYAVSELGNDGRTNGTVSSFAIDRATGKLTFLNKVSSGGGGACHLAMDKTGKTIFVADYGSGKAAAIRINSDGSLGDQTAIEQHSGSSVNPARQKGPHAHSVVLSRDNRFLFVPDLGLDKIFSYRFDAPAGSLSPNDPPFAGVKPGSGPRHMAFHPNGRFAYVVDEMGSRVSAFSYDASRGAMAPLQDISTLPEGFSGTDNSAEIEVDGKGAHLYASNRGADTIAVFDIDKQGKLTKVQDAPTQGHTPRNFRIDPTGKFLLAANQDSNNVVVFRIDSKNGRLSPTGDTFSVPSPVCILFVGM